MLSTCSPKIAAHSDVNRNNTDEQQEYTGVKLQSKYRDVFERVVGLKQPCFYGLNVSNFELNTICLHALMSITAS